MSTYAVNPHIYGEIVGGPIPDGNSPTTLATIDRMLFALYFFFLESGWTVEWVNPVVRLSTQLGLFPFCLTNLSEWASYAVSCTVPGGSQDQSGHSVFEEERVLSEEDGGCCGDDGQDCKDILAGFGLVESGYHFVLQPLTLAQTHTAAREAVVPGWEHCSSTGIAPIDFYDGGGGGTQWPTVGLHRTTYQVSGGNKLIGFSGLPTVNLANAGGTDSPSWAGFIATCQDSSVEGNHVSLYVTHGRVSASETPLITVYTRKSWAQADTGVPHPSMLFVVPNGVRTVSELAGGPAFGDGSSPIAQPLRRHLINPAHDIKIYANSHQVFLHQPDTPGSTTKGLCAGAMKIRPLEGENPFDPGTWNLQEAWYALGQTVLLLNVNNWIDNQDDNAGRMRIGGPNMPGGYREAVGIGRLYHSAWNVSRPNNSIIVAQGGINWIGGAAPLMEPWCAMGHMVSGFTQSTNFNHPIIGQLWDAIVPFRTISTSIPSLFRWDGQWWRYFQLSKVDPFPTTGLNNVPSSMALRVADSQVFIGSSVFRCADDVPIFEPRGFEGPILQDILSVGLAGSAPGVITVTVTLVEPAPEEEQELVECGGEIQVVTHPARQVQIHVESDSVRVSYPNGNFITIDPGASLGTLDVSVSDIDYAQNISIIVRSNNQISTPLSISA